MGLVFGPMGKSEEKKDCDGSILRAWGAAVLRPYTSVVSVEMWQVCVDQKDGDWARAAETFGVGRC